MSRKNKITCELSVLVLTSMPPYLLANISREGACSATEKYSLHVCSLHRKIDRAGNQNETHCGLAIQTTLPDKGTVVSGYNGAYLRKGPWFPDIMEPS